MILLDTGSCPKNQQFDGFVLCTNETGPLFTGDLLMELSGFVGLTSGLGLVTPTRNEEVHHSH